jgi:hypothetical protein
MGLSPEDEGMRLILEVGLDGPRFSEKMFLNITNNQ